MSGDRYLDDRIFVSIASYRDDDLPRTICSAMESAARPGRLRFSICQQYDEFTEADLGPWADDPRLVIDPVHFADARGVGWARSRTQRCYDHEPYYLQIDAHMRFAPGWDEQSVAMLRATPSDRPVLTNYPRGFKRNSDGSESRESRSFPRRLGLEPSRPPGSLQQRAEPQPKSGVPGRHVFVAAGNLFTIGRFCLDVPDDPEIYYRGEEISLAARAHTHGYDLFWPNRNVLWHWYQRGTPNHWDDHADSDMLEAATHERVRRLLSGGDGFGRYGLGTVRTLASYQHLAGLALPPDRYGDTSGAA